MKVALLCRRTCLFARLADTVVDRYSVWKSGERAQLETFNARLAEPAVGRRNRRADPRFR